MRIAAIAMTVSLTALTIVTQGVPSPEDGIGLHGPEVVCAASDTVETMKKYAKYVCDAADARPVLQSAINEASRLGVRCLILPGKYVINSFSDVGSDPAICRKGAIYVPNYEGKQAKSQAWWALGPTRYNSIEGTVPPMMDHGAVELVMGQELYDSIPADGEPFSFLFCVYNDIYGRVWQLKNLVIRFPAMQKPIVAVDGRFCAGLRYENLWVSGYEMSKVNLRTGEGIGVPHPKSVGVRGTCGSNTGPASMRNVVSCGFGHGFDIGGEHLTGDNLAACYCLYGFAFDCYVGKGSIAEPDTRGRGHGCSSYPIVLSNLCDEHNVNLPLFGCSSHGDDTRDCVAQSVLIRGYQFQWPNTAPGYSDRKSPDFLKGRHRACEVRPGSWHGSVEYVADWTTDGGGVNLTEGRFFELGHGGNLLCRNLQSKLKGTTADRLKLQPNDNQQFFDTDLNKLLFFDGREWRTCDGTPCNSNEKQ